VDPGLIRRYVDWEVFGHFSNASRVRGGDWDRAASPLDSLGKYVLIQEVLRGDRTASELTDDSLRASGYNDSAARLYGDRDYGAYLERLRDSLAASGYHIVPPEDLASPHARFDQVAVDIGRSTDCPGRCASTILTAIGSSNIATSANFASTDQTDPSEGFGMRRCAWNIWRSCGSNGGVRLTVLWQKRPTGLQARRDEADWGPGGNGAGQEKTKKHQTKGDKQ
jgi:hypothetical protein